MASSATATVPDDSTAAPTGTPVGALKQVSDHWLSESTPRPVQQDQLNAQVLAAVQTSNAETAAYATTQVAVAPNMMITQASGLMAQAAAAYFDSVSKLGLATQGVLLKQMTENIAKQDMQGAADDAIGALLTDLLVGGAAAVAAAVGVVEASAAQNAMKAIDQSIDKTKALLGAGGGGA